MSAEKVPYEVRLKSRAANKPQNEVARAARSSRVAGDRSRKSTADSIGAFYEPADSRNAVRLEMWRLFIAETFKINNDIARTLRKLLPIYKQDSTSPAVDEAINNWIRLFNFPPSLVMKGENIFIGEFLSRLAAEILRYWSRNERAAKRFEVPPRPATWTWGNTREEELSTITFPPVTWRFRVEKRNEFARRTAKEQKQFLAERLDEIEGRWAAMETFERTPRIRINDSSHIHWAARMQILGDKPRESERAAVMKGVRHVFRLMGVNPMKNIGRPGHK